MGMSTHIKAFIPDTDPEYQKHKEIFMMCRKHFVSLPKETQVYFNDSMEWSALDEKLEIKLKEGEHYTYWADSAEGSQGFEVDLTKLPKGVTKIRFFNNW